MVLMPSHTRSPHAQPHSSPTNGLLHLATCWFAVRGIAHPRQQRIEIITCDTPPHICAWVTSPEYCYQANDHSSPFLTASFIAYPLSYTCEAYKFGSNDLFCLFCMITAKANGNLYRFRKQGMNITVTFFDLLFTLSGLPTDPWADTIAWYNRMVFDDAALFLDEDEAKPVPSATNNILAHFAPRTEFICSKNVHSLIQSPKYADANVLYSLSDPIQTLPLAFFHLMTIAHYCNIFIRN
ncbi:hypothetical protein K438DRAFT_2162647 [Mycena galopus ATCC 62051]|nr:hypothetical protein K438DRAFT_2162647 [Mycena galopus ATCC 62051]